MPEIEVCRSMQRTEWAAKTLCEPAFRMVAFIKLRPVLCWWALVLTAASAGFPASVSAADGPVAGQPASRVEARSADLLAVGIVHDGHMAIHLSRLLDNAPVRDASLSVVLRGVVHPTTAETDGSYALQTPDLNLPGSAALVFQVVQQDTHEDFKGTLDVAAGPAKAQDTNGPRQLWWWVLNFAVCIGFLMLIARRRKTAAAAKD